MGKSWKKPAIAGVLKGQKVTVGPREANKIKDNKIKANKIKAKRKAIREAKKEKQSNG